MPNLQAVKVTCRVALVPDLRMQMGALSQLVIEADLTFPYRDPQSLKFNALAEKRATRKTKKILETAMAVDDAIMRGKGKRRPSRTTGRGSGVTEGTRGGRRNPITAPEEATR